jgi:hypothetical protein
MEVRDMHRFLVGNPEGKRPLGRSNVDGTIILRLMEGRMCTVFWWGNLR